MSYWLVKFAPFRCGWKDILRNGKFEIYSVRNPQARNNLKAMKVGDDALLYHSQIENCIKGRMRVIEEAHQDKTTKDDRWISVTFEPVCTFDNPIDLQKIKQTKELNNIGLIKQPRLSVMKLTESEYITLCNLEVKVH